MRALITGATGFIGSHLTRILLAQGASLAILKRTNRPAARIHDLLPHVTPIIGDLQHIEQIEAPVMAFKPDVIFHLGWHGVDNTQRDNPEQVYINLHGSMALVELAIKAGCKTFIGLGSQAEYGVHTQQIDEHTPTLPVTLYGTVKLCVSLLAQQRLLSTSTRFVWLRVFSVYGPGDHPNTLISYLIRTLLKREKPKLTPGEQLWDYLYVEDAAHAIYQTFLTPDASGIFNLGSGEVQTIRYAAETIRDIIDPNLPLGIGDVLYQDNQIMHLHANINRLQKVTDWKPQTPLQTGLKRTIESVKNDPWPL